jgi:SAM-dependent methyltransferase
MTFDPKEYWERRLSSNYGLHGVGFLALGKNYNNWLYKVKGHIFSKLAKRILLKVDEFSVLDVGSGTGFYIERMIHDGFKKITGSDLTEVAVTCLKERFPSIPFVRLDIGNDAIDFEGRKFDMITAFDVLFHIVDDERFINALRNIHSLLNPGGIFVFSDNFLHGEIKRAEYQVCRPLAYIEESLDSVGFQVLKRTPMFVLMNVPIDSTSVWRWELWNIISLFVRKDEFLGLLIGALLYPIEILLTAMKKEGPSTEIMLCRKYEHSDDS